MLDGRLIIIASVITVALCTLNHTESLKTPHIVGGEDADRNEYPWHIMLYYGDHFTCGGSILNDTVIMTAAHCVDRDPTQLHDTFKVATGVYRKGDDGLPAKYKQFVSVKTVIMHERYENQLVEKKQKVVKNDIALLILAAPLNLTAEVYPVELSYAEFDKRAIRSNNCWAIGFGIFKDNWEPKLPKKLQEVRSNVIPNKRCMRFFKRTAIRLREKQHVCIYQPPRGTCSGDSGGAVGCYDGNGTFRQVGITSFGPNMCRLGYSVFARVSGYLRWIGEKIQMNKTLTILD